MTTTSTQPWSEYWAEQARSGNRGRGCVPSDFAALDQLFSATWKEIASSLPEGGRILEIAAGAGTVSRWIKETRADLQLTGIDRAGPLPQVAGITLHGGIAMESLPFKDDSFDGAVSQFGLEYGDVSQAARELARVLVPGAHFHALLHRGNGVILEHNMIRRAAIRWALQDSGLFPHVFEVLATEGTDAALSLAQQAATEGTRLYGAGSAAWEISEAARQTLQMGRGAGAASQRNTLQVLRQRAGEELARLDELESASRTADDREALETAFADAGFAMSGVREIRMPEGQLLGDLIAFQLD